MGSRPDRGLNLHGWRYPAWVNRFVAVVACFTIFLAACGVDRSSEDTLAEDADASADQVSSDDSVSAEDGGESGDAGDGTATTLAPPTTAVPLPPPTTGPPAEVVLSADFGDTQWEITHGDLNDIVVSTQENEEFVALVFGGQQPQGFAAGVLTEHLTSQAVQVELAEVGGVITDEDLAESREQLLAQVQTLYPASADPVADAERLYDEVPYLPFLAEYQAGQNALSAILAESAGPGEGNPCVRHILVETEAEGDDLVAQLGDGADFSNLAIEFSTGPSGPAGGDLGCAPAANYVPAFAEAVTNSEVGEVAGPVETQFGWHVIIVDRYEIDGRTIASDLLRERLASASVDVDENLGSWDTERLLIIPFGA